MLPIPPPRPTNNNDLSIYFSLKNKLTENRFILADFMKNASVKRVANFYVKFLISHFQF